MIVETEKRANDILARHGKEDGQKHIDQILYFCEHLSSDSLLKYWNLVNKNFKNAVDNYTSDKKIRPWLPR